MQTRIDDLGHLGDIQLAAQELINLGDEWRGILEHLIIIYVETLDIGLAAHPGIDLLQVFLE